MMATENASSAKGGMAAPDDGAAGSGTVANAAQKAGQVARAKTRRASTPRPFPSVPLEKALTVALAIKEKNAGNPWPPTQVAKALGIAEKSSSIDALYRSSALYGLTTGTRAASYISLEKNGREIVYAPNADQELHAKRLAFLNVELFSKILEYYKGNNLPDVQFFSNTLVKEFNVPVEFHEEFKRIFQENCSFVGIGSDWQGLTTPSAKSCALVPKRLRSLAMRRKLIRTGRIASSLCHSPSGYLIAQKGSSKKFLKA